MGWQDLTDSEHLEGWTYGTMVISSFIYWILTEILERKCGMEPQIYISNKISHLAKAIEDNSRNTSTMHMANINSNNNNDRKNESDTVMKQIEMIKQQSAGVSSSSPVDAIGSASVSVGDTALSMGGSASASVGNASIQSWSDHAKTMPYRLTKQFDSKGRYRVTIRVSVIVIRFLWSFILSVVSIVSFYYYDFWYDMLWKMDDNTNYFIPYRICAVLIMSFYIYELNVSRYGKLSWSQIAHHVGACFTSFQIIVFDTFTPAALVYGTFGIGFTWPVDLALVFRNTKWGHNNPNLTRKMFVIAYWNYLILNSIMNMGLQIGIIIRGLITGKFAIVQICITSVLLVIWMYDDHKLLKILKEYSLHHYEIAQLLQLKQIKTVRTLEIHNDADDDNDDVINNNNNNNDVGNHSAK